MAKKESGSWWPWLVGGAVLTVGGIAIAKALATTEAPRAPTFWERHGWDPTGIDSEGNDVPMPASALEEIRADMVKFLASNGVKFDPKNITVKKRHMEVDAQSLSENDKAILKKLRWPDGSQYGLTGRGVTYFIGKPVPLAPASPAKK